MSKYEKLAQEALENNNIITRLLIWINGYNEPKHKASENYFNAGNQYTIDKDYENAVKCFIKSIELNIEICEDYYDNLEHLAVCYSYLNDKVNLINTYSQLAEIYKNKARLDRYNEQLIKIASIYENDELYLNALEELNKTSPHVRNYNDILNKKSLLMIKTNDYEKAYEINKELYNEEKIKKSGIITAKKYAYNSLIYSMAWDIIPMNKFYKIIYDESPGYFSYGEGMIISKLIDSINSNDIEKFENAINERDKIKELTKDEIKIFTKIKKEYFDEILNNNYESEIIDLC